MQTSEEWRPVVGRELEYEVSSLGRVRSFDRTVLKTNGVTYHVKPKILNPASDRAGYRSVNLSKNDRSFSCKVHRLVALAFLEKTASEVNHKNGDKSDNRASNLEWVTPKQNVAHAWATGLAKPRKGARAGNVKLTETQVLEIRRRCKLGESDSSLGREYSVSAQCIRHIRVRINWSHVP